MNRETPEVVESSGAADSTRQKGATTVHYFSIQVSTSTLAV
jgi:hypothetical protein